MTDSELPAGWIETPLDQVAEVRLGRQRSPDKASGPHMRPYVRAANATWGGLDLSDVKEMNFDPSETETYLLRHGDVLLSEASGSASEVGKPFVWRDEIPGCCFQNTLIRVRSHGPLPEYLYYHFLNDARGGRFADAGKGIGINHLGAARMSSWPTRLAPLEEQRRIVAKLDEARTRSRSVRETLDAIPALLDRYRQSVLAAAFRGDLTAEWRTQHRDAESGVDLLRRLGGPLAASALPSGDPLPELPDGWCWAALGQVLTTLRNGIATKPDKGDGLPILRISAVRPLSVSVGDTRFLDRIPGYDEYLLRDGDLLFTRYNGNPELVGVCGLVRGVTGDLVYPDKLIRGRTIQGLALPEFLELALNAGLSRHFIASKCKTAAGQVGISGGDLKCTPIPLPPIEEQAVISSVASRLLAKNTAVSAIISEAAQRLVALDKAVLARAFRGELVPQDPADEPASVLLERIKAEQATATVPKVGRGRKPRQLAEVTR